MIWLAIPLFVWDIGVDDAGIVAAGDTLQWAWSAAPSAGPGPSNPAWCTVPNGQYLHDADDSMVVALPDLSSAIRPMMRVEHWYATAVGDRAVFEVDDGSGFMEVAPVGGYPAVDGFVGGPSGWTTSAVELPTVLGGTFRLRMVSDASVADAGWYVRALEAIDGDISPPVIESVIEPEDSQDLDGPYVVAVQVSDDVAVATVTLSILIDGVDQGDELMVLGLDDTFTASIPGGLPPDTVVSWRVSATDGEQVSRYPSAGDASFRVFLAAPLNLRAPDVGLHTAASQVQLIWNPPVGPHPVLGYVVSELDGATVETSEPTFLWPLTQESSQQFDVRARFSEGVGDASNVLSLDVEVPELFDVRPGALYAGESGWVRVMGAGLYLVDGLSDVDFGDGTTVVDVVVHDVNDASVLVSVDSGAAVGPRGVRLQQTNFPDRFAVIDPATAPRVVDVRPGTLVQGEEATVTVLATHPFGDLVELDAGDDLVLTAPPRVDGKSLSFDLAVSTRALTGTRTLLLDDGERLWTIEIDVQEYNAPPQRSCNTGLEGGGLGANLVGMVTRRRPAPCTR